MLLGSAAVAAVYLLAVRTLIGQHLDLIAFEGRKSQPLWLRHTLTPWITPLSLAVGVALVALSAAAAVARSQPPRHLALTLFGVAVAVSVSALLKDTLPRPVLIDNANVGPRNTFPSGHAAGLMAAAIGIAALPSSAPARRTTWVGIGLIVAVVVVMNSGWHRPSDVLAGLLIGAVAMSTVSLPLSTDAVCHELPARHPVWITLAVTVAATTVLGNTPPDPRHNLLAHVIAVGSVASAGCELLRRALDPPGGIRTRQP